MPSNITLSIFRHIVLVSKPLNFFIKKPYFVVQKEVFKKYYLINCILRQICTQIFTPKHCARLSAITRCLNEVIQDGRLPTVNFASFHFSKDAFLKDESVFSQNTLFLHHIF